MKKFLLLLLVPFVMVAQTTTHIHDILLNPTDTVTSGSTVSGTLKLTSNSWDVNGRKIVKTIAPITITAGVVDLDLAPNDTATNTNSYYIAEYSIKSRDNRTTTNYSEKWQVPTSDIDKTISEITVNTTQNPSINPVLSSQIVPGTVGQCLITLNTSPITVGWSDDCGSGGGGASPGGTDGQIQYRLNSTTLGGFSPKVNGTNVTTPSGLNFLNSDAFNGLTVSYTNPSAGGIKLGLSGTLDNAGLTNDNFAVTYPSWLTGPSVVALGGTLNVSAASGQTSGRVLGTCGSSTSVSLCALQSGDIPSLNYQAPLGFTPENISNKNTSTSLGVSNTDYPTQNAVKTYVDSGLAGKQNSLGYTAEDSANKDNNTSLGVSTSAYPTQNAVKQYVDTGLLTKQNDLGFTPLDPANNLSELTATASTARTNLGLGTAATHPSTDFEVPLTFGVGLNRTSNAITIPNAGVSNAMLANSNISFVLPSWLSGNGPTALGGTFTASAATGQATHKVLGTCGTATSVSLCSLVSGDIPTLNQNTTGVAANVTGVIARANGGLNSATPGTGLLRDGATPAASELSGDASTSGSNVVTVAKVNGVSYGTSPATNTLPVVTAANTITYEKVPTAALVGDFVQHTEAERTAPTTPALGTGSFWFDSGTHTPTFLQNNSANRFVPVISKNAGDIHQWLSYIDASGTQNLTQPSYSDLSGLLDLSSMVTGNLGVSHLNSGTGASSSTFWRGDGTWAAPSGTGTVTVVGAGSLTSTGCVTGGGTQTIQTPSANCTVDSSGNLAAQSVKTGGSTPTSSGIVTLNGVTSGTAAWGAADVAGTSIAYVMPSTNGVANQVLKDTGLTTCPTYPAGSPTTCHQTTWSDSRDVKIIPFAAAPAGTAGSGVSYSSGWTPTARGGSNNIGAAMQAIPSGGTVSLQWRMELPLDWDTGTNGQPYIRLEYGSGLNTTGTVIWTVSSACTKADGSTSDDPAFNAETAFTSQAMGATTNRAWSQTGHFTAITSANNCVPGGGIIIKASLSGTAASAINAYQAVVTIPTLPNAGQAE